MVKVRYSEGVAIHTDPECCAGHCREAVREALTGGAYRRGSKPCVAHPSSTPGAIPTSICAAMPMT
jgi:hypothetical protein